MRKPSLPVAFIVGSCVAVAVAGCSFQVGSKDPATPGTPAATPAAAGVTPAPANTTPGNAGKKPVSLGRGKPIGGLATPAHPPAAPGTTPPPAGIPLLVGTNVFGTATPSATGWKGSYFAIAAGTTKIPVFPATPNGILFANSLNIANTTMSGGFPGIDAARNENFGIRWEAPLVVDTESDYTFRLVSDDGAVVKIDDTLIVDNDGVHTVTEKTGPVHLITGTHAITVDYFQGTGPVALQLFCKKGTAAEQVCPTHLL